MTQLRSKMKVAERSACVLLCTVLAASAVTPVQAAGKAQDDSLRHRAVYFNGKVVQLRFEASQRKSRTFDFGPWKLTAHVVHEKPRDPHPNMYIVAPGDQYSREAFPQYDHNEIISTIPRKNGPVEWDVYWALVIDPNLDADFRSERQLLLAVQGQFEPQPGFSFDEIPAAAYLRHFLQVESIEDLQRYRRPDGALPRLLIVPAGISIRAEAVDENAEAEKATVPDFPSSFSDIPRRKRPMQREK